MDDFPPDQGRLFSEEESVDVFEVGVSMLRCKCGALVSVTMPTRCEQCKKPHAYWRDIHGKVLHLSKMGLGHLNNCVRMLAAKSEQYPAELRGKFEIALDILYAEIGSRDKEIQQVTGIHSALLRSLDK
jgi:hypothetical protein